MCHTVLTFNDRIMIIVSLSFCIGVGLTRTSGNFFGAFSKKWFFRIRLKIHVPEKPFLFLIGYSVIILSQAS